MPKQKVRKYNPYTRTLIIVIASVAIIIGVVITVLIIKNKSKTASPENALKTNNIDTSLISKIVDSDNLSVAVETLPNKTPVLYQCSKTDGKWTFEKKVTVQLRPLQNDSYIFTDKETKKAMIVLFAYDESINSVQLLSDDKSTKTPISNIKSGGQNVFVFDFNNPLQDKHSYTAIEYDKDGKELNSPNFKFNDGYFHITCNNTEYNYDVHNCTDVANSFSYRISNLTPDFSNYQRKEDKNYNFVITYNSKTNTIITPSQFKDKGIEYKKVSILMPLDGDDSHIVYLDTATRGMICSTSADSLKDKTMKLISGK